MHESQSRRAPGPLKTLAIAVSMAAGTTGAFAQQDLMEEVIVTAEKRGQSLQDTATSMVIVTPERINELNIVNLDDALLRVGNAGFTSVGSGSNEQFVLRGVQSGGVTPGTTPVATLIVDGAFIPNQAAGATISNAWDVRQIEVLRGAQSTLQGRNSLIGAIVVNTEEPTAEWDFRGRATYAEQNTWETSIAFGGPIVDDQLMFRIAAQRTETDGFIERLDGTDGDAEESTLIRGKLRFEPDALPDLHWDLVATYSEEEDGNVLVSADDPYERIQVADIASITEREILTFGSTLSYEINERLEFTSVTNYARLETDEIQDFDGQEDTGAPVSPVRLNQRENEDFLQEFRFLYDNGSGFQALGGLLYAFRGNDDDTQVAQGLTAPGLDLGNVFFLGLPGLDPTYRNVTSAVTGGAASINTPASAPRRLNDPLLVGDSVTLGSDFVFQPEFDTFAIFGEASWDITPAFTVTAGFRYEREDASYEAFQVNRLLEPSDIQALTPEGNSGLAPAIEEALVTDLTPLLGADQAAAAAAAATPSITPAYAETLEGVLIAVNGGDENALEPISLDEDQSFGVFLPKLVATWNLSDSVSLAASVQRAYRPGGIGINPVRSEAFIFDQEFSWNYELALRSISMNGKLLINANLFWIDWEDQQIEVQLSETPQDSATQNVGESELYGIEVQGVYNVTDNLQLFSSVGFVETEITGTDESNADLEGDEFPFAPSYSGSVGFTYQHPSGFGATVDASFLGESEPLLPNNSGSNPIFGSGLKNDDVVLTNARLSYRWDRFTAFVFGSNLFDEEYLINADALAGNVIVGDPRVIGAGFTFGL
ncbi:MAG: TonB-dependent receptor [Pseudomonadota bacterium]